MEVLKLHTAAKSAETAGRRKQKVDDVQKRGEYRKKHGLEHEGIGGWTAKTNQQDLGPAIETGILGGKVAVVADEVVPVGGEAEQQTQAVKKPVPVKKWLGIW